MGVADVQDCTRISGTSYSYILTVWLHLQLFASIYYGDGCFVVHSLLLKDKQLEASKTIRIRKIFFVAAKRIWYS